MVPRDLWAAAVLGALPLVLISASCGVISGLDDYSEGACTGACDGGADRAVAVREASPEANGQGGDEVVDESDATVSDDAAPDAAQDDADDAGDAQALPIPDSGADDAPAEAACDLGTPAHCSACGVACSTNTGTPSCSGATCTYACNAGRQDCNASSAPDKDGCECAGSGCCGGSCQTVHTSGIPSPANYSDCSATGNSTQSEAMAACTGTGGSGCAAKNTSCGGILGFGGTSTSAACGTVGGNCYCWVYSGQNSGEVHAGSSGCTIPCSSGSAWN